MKIGTFIKSDLLSAGRNHRVASPTSLACNSETAGVITFLYGYLGREYTMGWNRVPKP